MTAPVQTPETTPEDTLALTQQSVNALIDPALIADDINARLDRLFNDGADPGVIDAIAENTADLIDLTDTLHGHLHAVIESAHALRTQREEARQKLADLKCAINEVDTDVPEVEEFFEYVEEMLLDQWCDVQYENIGYEIAGNTGLDFKQSAQLVAFLTEGVLRSDHPLWNELVEWLTFARREAGYTD